MTEDNYEKKLVDEYVAARQAHEELKKQQGEVWDRVLHAEAKLLEHTVP